MFKQLDKSVFDNITFINPPVEFDFSYEWWEDKAFTKDEGWIDKIYRNVIGYAKINDKEPKYGVLCVGKSGQIVAFHINSPRFKNLKRWMEHIGEREELGVSFRDAWNIDLWLTDKTAKALGFLEKNTISFPNNANEMHRKLLEIDAKYPPYLVKSAEPNEEERKLSADDLSVKLYHDDIKRIKFLLEEYNEDTCSQKNQYQWNLEMKHEKITEGPHKGMYTLKFVGTKEQEEEAQRWRDRENEIDIYRSDCLHKAIKMLDLYIEHLWD